MSYSDIVGSISGLLQFAVACYALRVSRRYGMARVGWLFFGAYTMLAAVHVLLSVHPFGIQLDLGVSVNVLYEIISILLLGTIAQTEYMLWKHHRQVNAEAQARAQEEARIAAQVAQLTKTAEESKQTVVRLQAEAAQQTQQLQAFENAQAELMKSFEDQLSAAHQSEAALQETLTQVKAELARQMQVQMLEQTQAQERAQEQAQALEQLEKNYQEQLAALHQAEEVARASATAFQNELAQLKQTLEQTEKSYQEQLAASRQSEELWRETVARLQAEVPPPQPPPPPAPAAPPVPEPVQPAPEVIAGPDPLLVFRQSGIAEIATLTQSRVAYIARLARLLRDHSKHLSRFMTRTPQGKRLPGALSLLVDYLADEQFLLVKRIDHVKNIFSQPKAAVASPPPPPPPVPQEVIPVSEPIPVAPPVPLMAPPEAVEESSVQSLMEALREGDPVAAADHHDQDYRDHLISNVTETGTEMNAGSEEVSPSEVDTDFFGPSTAPGPGHGSFER